MAAHFGEPAADDLAARVTAGAVSIAHDLSGSEWKIGGAMSTFAVTGTASASVLRAAGSIASITLGAGDHSDFLAGVTADKTDPTAVTAADLNTASKITTLTVKGWTVASGPVPDFLSNCRFLAPQFGTISILNAVPGTWDVLAQTTAPNQYKISSITAKDPRFPLDTTKNWTWLPGQTITPAMDAAMDQIPLVP